MLEEVNRYVVTIVTENRKNKKTDMKVIETDTINGAIRIMHTFRPKRGHKIVYAMFEEVVLFI